MPKRLILLCICLCMLTGCGQASDVQYDLNIENDLVNENLSFSLARDEVEESVIQNFSEHKIPASMDSNVDIYYNYSMNVNDDYYRLNYSYQRNLVDLPNSFFAGECYQEISVTNDEDLITLNSSNEFLCLELEDGVSVDNVEINITTDLRVTRQNADEVNGNTYTWNVDITNYDNTPIDITLKRNNSVSIEDVEVNEASYLSFIIFGSIALVLIIITAIAYFKRKKSNDI